MPDTTGWERDCPTSRIRRADLHRPYAQTGIAVRPPGTMSPPSCGSPSYRYCSPPPRRRRPESQRHTPASLWARTGSSRAHRASPSAAVPAPRVLPQPDRRRAVPHRPLLSRPLHAPSSARLGKSKDEHGVTERITELEISARRDRDELLSVDLENRRSGVDAGAAIELPQHRAGARIIRLEPAVALTREHQAAGRGRGAADHRLIRLDLPGDLAGLQVDSRHVTPLRLARNGDECAPQPQTAALVGRVVRLV